MTTPGWPQRWRKLGGRVVHAAYTIPTLPEGFGFRITTPCCPDETRYLGGNNVAKHILPNDTEVTCKACLASACYRNSLRRTAYFVLIDTSGPAFLPQPHLECARILRSLADRISDLADGVLAQDLTDILGNAVGRAKHEVRHK